mmetsp:Transcript_47680/g.138918  ORF Transcript_47680/g.138918 Transcript_47680/m.138918 type:complete len:245 (-) Transcript_47680:370-1104(-)
MDPSIVLNGMPKDFQPRAYQCAELDAVPNISLVLPLGTFTMTQLWSVLAPRRPARQTVVRVWALVPSGTSFMPSFGSAPREPVSTRMVDNGAFSGSSCLSSSLLSSFSCKIQLPPWSTFFNTWIPMPPSSMTSLATNVTGLSMTGVTGSPLSKHALMNFHLSSISKSLLCVASAVIDANRQFNRHNCNQSLGASNERSKHSAAEDSRPCNFRQHEPKNAAVGITNNVVNTACTRERAQRDNGTP